MYPTQATRIEIPPLRSEIVPRLIFMAFFLLSGCALGPDFVRPAQREIVWNAPLPHGGKVESLSQWWEKFNDPLLTRLIAEAEKNNPTLDQALAKMMEARANSDASDATVNPSVSANLGTSRNKAAFGRQIFMLPMSKAGFDALWEADIFGKNRRNREAARARLNMSETGWHDARISLAAEVAESYIETRACEAAAGSLENLWLSQKKSLEMVSLRQDAGFSSLTDVSRMAAAAAESLSSLEGKRGECAQSVNRLVALTGMSYASLQKELIPGRGVIPVPSEMDVSSVAAKVLSQRPDVAMAEYDLAAASAEIGVARADLFPSLTLSGSVAVNSFGKGNTVSTWSFGPALLIPVFNGGKTQSYAEAAEARRDYALAGYRKTVREAVKEVEDALVRLDVARKRLAQSGSVMEKNQSIAKAARQRLDAGMASDLDFEESERSFLQSQISFSNSSKEGVSAWIALYKALGGGWDGNPAVLAKTSETAQR